MDSDQHHHHHRHRLDHPAGVRTGLTVCKTHFKIVPHHFLCKIENRFVIPKGRSTTDLTKVTCGTCRRLLMERGIVSLTFYARRPPNQGVEGPSVDA